MVAGVFGPFTAEKMNQTEANEAVLKAAELFEARVPGACVTLPSGRVIRLSVAIRKVTPKIARMRSRLDALRARKTPVKNGPQWLRAL